MIRMINNQKKYCYIIMGPKIIIMIYFLLYGIGVVLYSGFGGNRELLLNSIGISYILNVFFNKS